MHGVQEGDGSLARDRAQVLSPLWKRGGGMTEQERKDIYRKIRSLQNSRDYAAPELEGQYTREIERLLARLEEDDEG